MQKTTDIIKRWSIIVLNRLKTMHFWADLGGRKPTSGRQIPVFDGLRGIAALIVLADHSKLIEVGRGGNGVWLFFALSGYLLSLPIVYKQDFWTRENIIFYFSRRVARILPMYFFTIALFALFFGQFDVRWFGNHLLFLQADMHLWTVKQELLFYLLLPLLIFPLTAFPGKDTIKCALLYVLSVLLGLYLTVDVFSISGMRGNLQLPFQLPPFISGMAAVFLSKIVTEQTQDRQIPPSLISVLIILILGLSYLFNEHYVVGASSFDIWRLGILFSLLLVLVQLPSLAITEKVFSFLPFRAIGIVGYSFYLLHWPVILGLQYHYGKDHFSPEEMFFLAGTISYIVSCISYTFIEKPGMTLIPAWTRKITTRFL